MHDRQDMPSTIPDCAPPADIRAERIRLWRLFDQAAEVNCDLDITLRKEPLALQVLNDWARDRGRSADPVHHLATEHSPAFTVWKCDTGMGSIAVYSCEEIS